MSFLDYLWGRRLWLGSFVFLLLFLALIFLSFELPYEPLIYGLFLVLLFLALFMAVDYARLKKERKRVLDYKEPTKQLQESKDPLGKAYIEVIGKHRELLFHQESQTKQKLHQLEDYYTIWAHQIKTPIAGLSLLLEEEKMNKASMRAELFKIDSYVEMLLGFLRLESPSTDYVFIHISLDEVLRKSIRKYASLFIGKKLSLVYEPIQEKVLTDEKWFSFLFEQLLSNAIKYTDQGEIKIYWKDSTLRIKDSGIGIPEEDLPRVFEMGYTGYNGRIDKKSTGVGLALCERIAKELSLGIRIVSKLDEGTEVEISFPKQQLK